VKAVLIGKTDGLLCFGPSGKAMMYITEK